MPATNILIVGGGPAGLTTAGALKQAGFASVILDGSDRIGQSWEQRYDRLHLHTVRSYSGLAGFPIPRNYPNYLSKDQYADYLRAYAAYFDLSFMPRTRVRRIRPEPGNGQPAWAVETSDQTWLAHVVIVATGQYEYPYIPNWPGLASFQGETMHSSRYCSGRTFQGRPVLVIGAGNSGLEIAVDLVEQGAAHVAVSVRSAPPVVPRDFMGVPVQVFGILMNALPPALSDRVGQMISRLAMGDLRRLGIPAPDWLPFASRRTPVIDVGFVQALKAGKVQVRPAVSSFTPDGVIYQDGREEAFEAVIFATGFRSGLEQLLEPEGLLDDCGNPAYPSGAPTRYPGLYFMGYFDSLRGFLYESNRASIRLARVIRAIL